MKENRKPVKITLVKTARISTEQSGSRTRQGSGSLGLRKVVNSRQTTLKSLNSSSTNTKENEVSRLGKNGVSGGGLPQFSIQLKET